MDKLEITFKMPDAEYFAVQHLTGEQKEKAREVCRKFIQYGEYITIEIDVENQTARVIPCAE